MAVQVNNNSNNGGIGFLGLLTIVFVTLKLTGHIAWSWWWVLAPLWGPLGLVLAAVLLFLVWMVLVEYPAKKRRAAKMAEELDRIRGRLKGA
jgi:Flp pilus assembly protein TadB